MATGTSGSFNWAFLGQGSLSADYRDNLLRCWDASNGPNPAVNGATITDWADISGNNHTLTQATGVYGALKYYVAIQNGLPATYCDGASTLGGANLADAVQPHTHFVVFKPTAWATGAEQNIIGMYQSTQLLGKTSGNTTSFIYAGTAMSGGVVSNNVAHIYTAVFNGATSSIQVDTGAATVGNVGTASSSMYPWVGGNANANYYTGYVMEWRVYTGVLTTDKQTQVRTFLNNKWGVY